MDLLARAAEGLVASGAISALAYRRGSLAPSGAAAAVAIGGLVYVGSGPVGFGALLVFFVTSSALARVGAARKAHTKREYSKSDTRDALQVLANGGVAAACALGFGLSGEPALAGAFVGALGTANGDTWATELGVLSRGEPFSLRSLRRVPRGTSGAVSGTGTLATFAGALLIGAVASLRASDFHLAPYALLGASAIGGVAGAFADSWLGASVQAAHHCPRCDVPTEGSRHHCGTPTAHTRGLAWFGNDAVNFTATVLGALCGAAGSWLL